MKTGIHPEYTEVKVHCSCGNEFMTKSTKGEEIKLDVCANCHPFYTGAKRSSAKDGRAELFNKKYGL